VTSARLLAAVAAAALALAPSCYGGSAQLSESGRGLPEVTVEFPASAAPGSTHVSFVRVTNPGPGDLSRVAVAFARVGAPAAEGLPNPIVDPGGGPDSGEVVGVAPEPSSVSDDGVVFRFGPLPEGESMTLEFRLRVPLRAGAAANSVTVYDDAEPGRAGGARLETTVEGGTV
jgi:hypothetical protein